MARRRSVSDLGGQGGTGPPAYDDRHFLESGVKDVGSTETDWTGQGMAVMGQLLPIGDRVVTVRYALIPDLPAIAPEREGST